MDEESPRHPSNLLLKLFQEAWKELCTERDEADPITTIEVETRDGEKKNVNGFEFWQQMIEEVEKQKDDPDYLFYSSTDEENIEDLFTTTDETQPYLHKIVRRKRYVSPSSTDDEIVFELIFAMEISEKMEKELLANEKKVNIIHENPETEVFKNPESPKPKEKENSQIIKMDALVQTEEQQINIGDMEYVRTIQTIERNTNQADELEKQLQTLETGNIYWEDLTEMEDPKETKQMSHKGKIEASSIIDISSGSEEEDEISEETEETSQQREFETSYFNDWESCIEDVGAVPEQAEQLSHERKSEDSNSTDLDEDSDVPLTNATHVQIAPNPYQDNVCRDNIATQNVNPQNFGMNMNYPIPITSPHIPVMVRPNYGRAPFFIQPGSFQKPVYPYKFCNPYYRRGPRHIVRNPFSSRPQHPFIPLPTHRQPRLFPQRPFAPIHSLPPPHMVPRATQQYFSRAQTALLPRMPPRLLFPYIPLIPTPPLARSLPPPAHQTQRTSYGDSAERNQQNVPYQSINPPTQCTPQSQPIIIFLNTIPDGDPEYFQVAHAPPRTQIAPNTTLASREIMVPDITNERPWEYIVIIKKKSGQRQLIARVPLSSIIPLPDDDIEDGNQDDIQSGNCELFENPSITANSKKSALRRHDVEQNQRTRRVNFSRSDIEKDEIKNESAQSKILNQKSNEDQPNYQPEASFDEREYLQTPSIFEILNSRKDADPNEPQKVPTNYMEDVIQRKERRWKSMDLVRGSPSLDLMLDMIRKDNEMLEEEERLQREQAEQIVSPSTARKIDYEKFDSMHPNEFIEMYPYESYEGAECLVENDPKITLELPEITKEPHSPTEITVSNPSDAGVILDINPENVTVLEHSLHEPKSPQEITILNPPDAVDILNPSPVTVLEHALQDISELEKINLDKKDEVVHLADFSELEKINLDKKDEVVQLTDFSELEKINLDKKDEVVQLTDFSELEKINLDKKDEVLQLTVHVDPSKNTSNLREFEDVLYKSDEKVSLSACDEIQQKVETIRVLPSADIQAIQDDPLKSQPLETGTNIHTVENIKIEIDDEEYALLNNLTTSNKRLSLGVLIPDTAVLKLKEELHTKWPKTNKNVAGVPLDNLSATSSLDQMSTKKLEKSSSFSFKRSQISSNNDPTQADKYLCKIAKRETSDNLDQAVNKMITSSKESPSELFNDESETCQVVVARDQATQTSDTDDTEKNLDVAVDEKDESTQTDEEIKNIRSYAAIVRQNK